MRAARRPRSPDRGLRANAAPYRFLRPCRTFAAPAGRRSCGPACRWIPPEAGQSADHRPRQDRSFPAPRSPQCSRRARGVASSAPSAGALSSVERERSSGSRARFGRGRKSCTAFSGQVCRSLRHRRKVAGGVQPAGRRCHGRPAEPSAMGGDSKRSGFSASPSAEPSPSPRRAGRARAGWRR